LSYEFPQDFAQPIMSGSSSLYTAVTKHWPKIAAGCVVALGILEFVASSTTSDSALEFYLLAWGSLTGGLWFIFDVAERSASQEVRLKFGAIFKTDNKVAFESLPDSFGILFDSVFGSKHLSWRCFRSSVLASVFAVFVVGILVYYSGAMRLDPINERFPFIFLNFLYLLVGAATVNAIPDYVSLLETRWLIRYSKSSVSFLSILLIDILLTTAIILAWISFLSFVIPPVFEFPDRTAYWVMQSPFYENWVYQIPVERAPTLENIPTIIFNYLLMPTTTTAILGVYFYSTFFTSFWLWVYMLIVGLSRMLIRLNSGVGILLRVTDVEEQPFRSLGFVSVVLVSSFFLLGLPFAVL
ncbi:MAG: hypothetical protein MJA83_05985, partial [Gammaproteobacteria bacterium]|nr:hypothetical protein [Gammaproteobacteria bacterium]